MLLRSSSLAAVALALAALATPARALVLQYDVAGGSQSVNSGAGLTIQTQNSATLGAQIFNLNDNQSFTFNFFKIWTDEGSIEADDLFPRSISATLNFDNPLAGGTVTGATVGGTILFASAGTVNWGGPALVVAGDRTFEITLSNETFNAGAFFNLTPGSAHGAWVEATVKQISSRPTNTAAVPDGGSTVVLLGAALAALGLIRGSRK